MSQKNLTSEEWKDRGNAAFSKKDYEDALTAYGSAIASCSDEEASKKRVHIYYSNRAAVYLALQRYLLALEDATMAIRANSEWAKGHFRRGEALIHLGRDKEAVLAYERAIELGGGSAAATALLRAQKKYISKFFSPIVQKLPVEVKYHSLERGRGVYASRGLKKGELIYHDAPVASHQLVKSNSPHTVVCSYTMQSVISPSLFPDSPEFHEKLNSYQKVSELIPCPHCNDSVFSESYISEEIRTKAWDEYHSLLCVGKEGEGSPYAELVLKAREIGKTNPLFIARMMSGMILRARRLQLAHPEKDRDEILIIAKEPYSIFVSNEETGPLDQETADTLKQLAPDFPELCDLSTYRTLHGAILRNAQALNPVTDLHLLLNSLPSQEQFAILRHLPTTAKTPYEFITSEPVTSLCIEGSGLFQLANSTNHSCDPNVMSVSTTNDYRVAMIAMKDIKPGEELCISYIDESMPWIDRQNKLREMYLFECKCPKCLAMK